MKAILRIIVIALFTGLISGSPAMSQKEKVTLKKGKALFNKLKALKEPAKQPATKTTQTNKPMEGEPAGIKRKLTPPDVREQISNAQNAYTSNSYAQARFYVQQAIIGIELEIGYTILESMPEALFDVPADKSQDEVFSAGAGFIGMLVSRDYPQDIGHTKASVANNSALYANMQMAFSTYSMAGYDDQSKIIQFKGYKTLVEADDYNGFKMTIPFAQSSLFILNCRTCESEDELLKMANLFDIDNYSKLLGGK